MTNVVYTFNPSEKKGFRDPKHPQNIFIRSISSCPSRVSAKYVLTCTDTDTHQPRSLVLAGCQHCFHLSLFSLHSQLFSSITSPLISCRQLRSRNGSTVLNPVQTQTCCGRTCTHTPGWTCCLCSGEAAVEAAELQQHTFAKTSIVKSPRTVCQNRCPVPSERS